MKHLILENVSLVLVSSVKINESLFALNISQSCIRFKETLFFTSEKINSLSNAKIIKINKIKNLQDYSIFILRELFEYINTEYVLVIQHDGFILNPKFWNPEFLNYDYIGAPWPNKLIISGEYNLTLNVSKNVVGNGGFSLRSKRLLEATSKFDLDNINFPIIEDLLISYFYYEKLVGLGFKFPTPEMAASFSVELAESCYGFGPNTSFGFHGEELKQIIYKSILNEF